MKPLKIGIVEDDHNIAEMLEFILQKEGHTVVFKSDNFTDSKCLIEVEQPHLVFLDITLKNGTEGFDVAYWIREENNIPFIFLTSHSDPGTLKIAKSLFPNGFLVKPFKREDIIVAIEIGFNENVVDPAELKLVRDFSDYKHLEGSETFLEDSIFIRYRKLYLKILYSEIQWLQADGNYTIIFCTKGKYSVRLCLKEVENKLPNNQFLRIHKSYVINIAAISAISVNHVMIGEVDIPISRTMQSWIVSKLNLLSNDN